MDELYEQIKSATLQGWLVTFDPSEFAEGWIDIVVSKPCTELRAFHPFNLSHPQSDGNLLAEFVKSTIAKAERIKDETP